MKSLDKYIIEAGGFFGNTKTSKTDLVMDWIKTYIPSVLKNPDSIKIDDGGVISISNNNNYNIYCIGDENSPALDSMPPVKFILKYKREPWSGHLSYKCDIKKFGFPLNIDDFDNLSIYRYENMSESEFQKMLKMINDVETIKNVYFRSRGLLNINKLIDGKQLKLLKRHFNSINIHPGHFDKIEFDQNAHIDKVSFLKDNKILNILNNHPKIITLPICRNIHFAKIYTYDEIIDMLSDYIPNPNIRKINIIADKVSHGIENIKNIIFGKK